MIKQNMLMSYFLIIIQLSIQMIVRAFSAFSRLKTQQIIRLFSKDDFKDRPSQQQKSFFMRKNNKDKDRGNDKRQSDSSGKSIEQNGQRKKQNFKFNKKFQVDLPKSRTQYYNRNKDKPILQQKKQSQRFSLISQQQPISKQSIFFVNQQPQQKQKSQNQLPSKGPKLNLLNIETGIQNKFYNKLSQTDELLRSYLNNRNFHQLNQLLKQYSKLSNINDMQKQVFPLLITQNVKAYLEYLEFEKKDVKNLLQKILQKIYNQLLYHEEYDELSMFLGKLKEGQFKIQLSTLQVIFNDLPFNGINPNDIGLLEQKIKRKMALVHNILTNQQSYYDRLRRIKKQRNVDGEKIGNWFFILAELGLKKNIGKANFIKIYQDIIHKYNRFINLQKFYKSQYFTLIFEKHYFGSHTNANFMLQIITNISANNSINHCIYPLIEIMILYRTKYHKNPLPNVQSIIKYSNTLKIQKKYHDYLMVLSLGFYNGQENDVYQFLQSQTGKIVIQFAKNNNLYSIINRFYLGMSKIMLKRSQISTLEQNNNKNSQPTNNNKEHKHKNRHKNYLSYLISQIQTQQNQNRLILLFQILNYFQGRMDFDKIIQKLSPKQLKFITQQMNKLQKQNDKDNLTTFFQQYNHYTDHDMNSYQNVAQQLIFSILQKQSREKYKNKNSNDKILIGKAKRQIKEETTKLAEQLYRMDYIDIGINQANNQNQVPQEEEEEDEYYQESNTRETVPSEKVLDAVKASIKLNKLQLAYHIFQSSFMDQHIIQRTRKNIKFALRSFMIQSYSQQKQHISNQNQLISLIQQSVDTLSNQFIKSIYSRIQNFDELIYTYLPPDKYKYQFWNTTLMMDRSQQLLKMDSNYKINNLKYQPQYNILPQRQKQEFISNYQKNWRKRLNQQLGITSSARNSYQRQQDQVIKYDNQLELISGINQNFNIDKVIKYKQQHNMILNQWEEAIAAKNVDRQEEEVNSGQVVEESVAVQQNVQQNIEAEVIQAAAQVQQNVVAEEIIEESQQQITNTANQQSQITPQQPKQQPISINLQTNTLQLGQQTLSIQDKLTLLAKKQKSLNIKGYDFTSFLELARSDIKPLLQNNYQTQKQFKKHVICLQSLVEEAMIFDNHYLQKKLFQFQQNVKSLENIAIFNVYGLWNFDFETVEKPQDYLKLTSQFRIRYFQFKKYKGKKGFEAGVNFNNKRSIIQKHEMQINLYASQSVIVDILLKKNHHFKKAQAIVKIKPMEQVQELMKWGLINDQPMAIYLAQKLAMVTNQTISHPMALRVSQYLSHRRAIPQERIERCKQCLKIVGRINREHIYDFTKDYQHITVRKNFQDYLQQQQSKLNSASLQFILRVDPTHSYQQQNFNLIHNLKKGNLTI